MTRGGRAWASIGAALVAHVAAGAVLLLVPVRTPAPRLPLLVDRSDETPIEITLDQPPPPTPAPALVEPVAAIDLRGHDVGVTDSPREAASRSVGPGESRESRAETPTPAGDVPPSSATRGGAVTFGAPRVRIDGPNPFLAPSTLTVAEPGEPPPRAAEEVADAKRRVEGALRQPARERERELGLGPEGPVLTALGEAASTSTAPVRGRAVFLAIANGAGDVVSIEVAGCDGAHGAWAQAATIALGSLKGKKLRVPSTATRAEMRIEVTSAWKLPSGQDPGADVSVLGIPVAKGEGNESTKVEILNPIPKVTMVPLSKDVKIPVVVWQVNIISTDGDPANIGAAARRVVHARLLDSKVL
jgi:hypothetical protein